MEWRTTCLRWYDYVHTEHVKCYMTDLLFLTQYLVQCSLHQTMEVSHTVMVSLELLYQLILWLPTVVPLGMY